MAEQRFFGRADYLDALRRHLDRVAAERAGLLLSVRGRRQVGKSALLDRFVEQSGVPHVYFAAAQHAHPAAELADFVAAVGRSSLEAARLFGGASFDSWSSALETLALSITQPSVVVLDELPYLLRGDAQLEGVLQRVWDRALSRAPVLVAVVGSDLSTMEMLSAYDRPLYGRLREMVIQPFTVAETADLLGLDAAPAFDAQLVTGGLPRLLREWGGSRGALAFVRTQLLESTSPLVVVGERALAAEFPPGLQAREVLAALGRGETAFGGIASRSGTNTGSLTRTLALLEAKRVVAVERPLSAAGSRLSRYVVADPYLRFWLRFVGPGMEAILRGRGDAVVAEVRVAWPAFRGRAVEALVRDSVARLLPDRHVGSYWTRDGQTEVDIVTAAGSSAPAAVTAVGSVKWRSRLPFGARDLAALAGVRALVPGADQAELIGVSLAGFSTDGLDHALTAADLLQAWRQPAWTDSQARVPRVADRT